MAELLRIPIHADDQRAITALRQCTFLPGSAQKRFVQGLSLTRQNRYHSQIAFIDALTLKQKWWLWRLVYQFRRQIDTETVLLAQRYAPGARTQKAKVASND
jgi:hypothetical protein